MVCYVEIEHCLTAIYPSPSPSPQSKTGDNQVPVKLTAFAVTDASPRSARYEIADSVQPGLRLIVQNVRREKLGLPI